jgi:alpha-galactosidase
LERIGEIWSGPNGSVSVKEGIVLSAKEATFVHIRFPISFGDDCAFLGDAWERGYGDLHWGNALARKMPWYFVGTGTQGPFGIGVETGANSLVWWEVDPDGVHLYADVRCGGMTVQLNGGALELCKIVTRIGEPDQSPFTFTQEFCRALCPRPIFPDQPVWGFNDWYYAYGSSTRDSILRDTATLAGLRPDKGSVPFSVIDMGWAAGYPRSDGGPQDAGNEKFGDMAELASAIRDSGARPGIWLRPLYTLPVAGLRTLHPTDSRGCDVLDPSDEAVLAYVRADMARCAEWGYEMVKHDFTTFDVLGRWGFEMQDGVTAGGWSFADRSRTTAQIIRTLYETIHSALGNSLIIGCNTIGHLIAGHAHLQRTGDDTSGREWARTLKMGVNSLAFRMPQHEAFFAVDADCVGLTNDVPWDKNAQWLDLLSRSGTPLFVSADPSALGTEQCDALREAFSRAAAPRDVAEPLDWQTTLTPAAWRTAEGERRYEW